MTTDNIRLRAEFLNTEVITRNTGKRLGVVREILVDIDRREVVSFGLRDNRFSLSGLPKYMYLTTVQQTGDVVLVENEDVIEDIDIAPYSTLVNCEVITETGEPLGRVRDFIFNVDDGRVSSLIIASIGIPQIPEQLISTYELPIDEVVSSGPNRLIVFEGAEDRLTQLTVGVLERIGIGRPPWEKEQEEMYYPPTAKPENQLGTGIPIRTPVTTPVKAKASVPEENWDDDDWEDRRTPVQPKRQEAVRYQEYEEEVEEEDNWGGRKDSRENQYSASSQSERYKYEQEPEDLWDDDVDSQPYQAPRVNIPQKQKERAPEYEDM